MAHLALYGNVNIPRTFCDDCERFALVIDRIKQCCNKPDLSRIEAVVRMSSPEQRRRQPPVRSKKIILESQGYRCLYCSQRFGSIVTIRGRDKILLCVWDHRVPFSLTQNNKSQNFVASCQYCNAWKSSFVFDLIEEVQVYVEEKWKKEKGLSATELPKQEMPKALSTTAKRSEVLLEQLPMGRMDRRQGKKDISKTDRRRGKKQQEKTKPIPEINHNACYACGKKEKSRGYYGPYCSSLCRKITWATANKYTHLFPKTGAFKDGLIKECLTCKKTIPVQRLTRRSHYCTTHCRNKAVNSRRMRQRLAEGE